MEINCYHNHMKNYFVYIWREAGIAGSGLPFYVGQGAHRTGGTDRQKYYRMYAKHRPHIQWKWDALAEAGTEPEAVIHADNLTKDEANAMEQLLIQRLGRIDNRTGILLNIADGGDANPTDAISSRNKLRASTTDKWKNPEYVDKAIGGMKNAWTDDRKKIAGKQVSTRWTDPEYRNNLIAKQKAQRNTPEGKAQQAKRTSKPITYNGVEYQSRGELSKAFNLDPVTCRKRLALGIPLDAEKYKIRVPYGSKR